MNLPYFVHGVCVSPNESDKNGHVEAQLVRNYSAGATSPAA
jgi:hypothetical protein